MKSTRVNTWAIPTAERATGPSFPIIKSCAIYTAVSIMPPPATGKVIQRTLLVSERSTLRPVDSTVVSSDLDMELKDVREYLGPSPWLRYRPA